jgi:hypothetical protein
MTAIEFEEVNVRIAEDQEEYETLPVYFNKEEGSMSFCFQLNKEEIDEVIKTGHVFFKQLTFGKPLQPVNMSVLKSDLIIKAQ